jgi:hypothetical protein
VVEGGDAQNIACHAVDRAMVGPQAVGDLTQGAGSWPPTRKLGVLGLEEVFVRRVPRSADGPSWWEVVGGIC